VPTLRHLIEELKELDVDPRDIRLPGPLYDDLVSQADNGHQDKWQMVPRKGYRQARICNF
jgi:hypothetical protein